MIGNKIEDKKGEETSQIYQNGLDYIMNLVRSAV